MKKIVHVAAAVITRPDGSVLLGQRAPDTFYPFSQEEYLDIVAHWLQQFGIGAADIAGAEREALNWALQRGSRSGRVAWQFAKDWAGSHARKPRK